MLGLDIGQLAVFVAGTCCARVGVGLVTMASVAMINRVAPPEHRAEVVSSFFIAAYAGLAIPALGVGIASEHVGFFRATLVCSIVLAALLGTVAVRVLGARPRLANRVFEHVRGAEPAAALLAIDHDHRARVRVEIRFSSTSSPRSWSQLGHLGSAIEELLPRRLQVKLRESIVSASPMFESLDFCTYRRTTSMQPRAAMSSSSAQSSSGRCAAWGPWSSVSACHGPVDDSPQRPSGRATPILVYRVADYADAIDRLRSAGVNDMRELELPQDLCEATAYLTDSALRSTS